MTCQSPKTLNTSTLQWNTLLPVIASPFSSLPLLAWWRSSNWNMQSFTSQPLIGNATLNGCRLRPISLSRSILERFYLIVLPTFFFKDLLKYIFFYLSPELHFWIIFLKNCLNSIIISGSTVLQSRDHQRDQQLLSNRKQTCQQLLQKLLSAVG